MTARFLNGLKIPSPCDTRCVACGRVTYVLPNGLCDRCQYRNDPAMRAWLDRQLAKVK